MELPEFKPSKPLTLGVELELQLIDWRTKDLCPAAPRIFEHLGGEQADIKSEIFQSMLEICTGVCQDVKGVRGDFQKTIQTLNGAARAVGVDVISAGTHPFADMRDRVIYPSERYRYLIDRNQWIARRLGIFGLHVHVGMPDGESAIRVMNRMAPYLAHMLALSASSPFLYSHDTGLASSRVTVFESQPTAGTPVLFRDWNEFMRFIRVAIEGRAISSLKDLWWDIRPSPGFGTLEIRVCDSPTRLSHILAIVALTQCLAARCLDEIAETKVSVREVPTTWRLRENKWRATRWGLDADILADEKGKLVNIREDILNLVVELEPYAHRLGCVDELRLVSELLAEKPAYSRIRKIYNKSRSFKTIVDVLGREWGANSELDYV